MRGKLAIEGGEKVRKTPFPNRGLIDNREEKAVLKLMKDSISGGKAFDRYGGTEVDAYEKEFAAYFGTKYATAISSGTGAVHSALAALHMEPLSEVISSPITDPGAVAPILWMNCIPVFADCDPETFNITAEHIEKCISNRTKAIVVGHIFGQPCDLDPIVKLAKKYKIPLIEDCSQSHDAEYKGKKIGSFGDMAVFSLMSGKHHTSGGQGGMVITNSEEYYWDAKRFADRGKSFNSDAGSNLFLGLNYRMTELEATIGRVQLKKLATIVEKKRKLAAKLEKAMKGLKAVRPGKVIKEVSSSYWSHFIRVDVSKLKVTKEEFAKALGAEGIPVDIKYGNLISQGKWIKERRTFGNSGWPWSCSDKKYDYEGTCPNAIKAIENHFTLYTNEGWGDKEVKDTAAAFKKVEAAYLK